MVSELAIAIAFARIAFDVAMTVGVGELTEVRAHVGTRRHAIGNIGLDIVIARITFGVAMRLIIGGGLANVRAHVSSGLNPIGNPPPVEVAISYFRITFNIAMAFPTGELTDVRAHVGTRRHAIGNIDLDTAIGGVTFGVAMRLIIGGGLANVRAHVSTGLNPIGNPPPVEVAISYFRITFNIAMAFPTGELTDVRAHVGTGLNPIGSNLPPVEVAITFFHMAFLTGELTEVGFHVGTLLIVKTWRKLVGHGVAPRDLELRCGAVDRDQTAVQRSVAAVAAEDQIFCIVTATEDSCDQMMNLETPRGAAAGHSASTTIAPIHEAPHRGRHVLRGAFGGIAIEGTEALGIAARACDVSRRELVFAATALLPTPTAVLAKRDRDLIRRFRTLGASAFEEVPRERGEDLVIGEHLSATAFILHRAPRIAQHGFRRRPNTFERDRPTGETWIRRIARIGPAAASRDHRFDLVDALASNRLEPGLLVVAGRHARELAHRRVRQATFEGFGELW